MNSPATTTMTIPNNDLVTHLEQIGLRAVAQNLDDFIARATKGRWSPRVLLEEVSQIESRERARLSLEHRASVVSNPSPTSIGTGPRKSSAM